MEYDILTYDEVVRRYGGTPESPEAALTAAKKDGIYCASDAEDLQYVQDPVMVKHIIQDIPARRLGWSIYLKNDYPNLETCEVDMVVERNVSCLRLRAVGGKFEAKTHEDFPALEYVGGDLLIRVGDYPVLKEVKGAVLEIGGAYVPELDLGEDIKEGYMRLLRLQDETSTFADLMNAPGVRHCSDVFDAARMLDGLAAPDLFCPVSGKNKVYTKLASVKFGFACDGFYVVGCVGNDRSGYIVLPFVGDERRREIVHVGIIDEYGEYESLEFLTSGIDTNGNIIRMLDRFIDMMVDDVMFPDVVVQENLMTDLRHHHSIYVVEREQFEKAEPAWVNAALDRIFSDEDNFMIFRIDNHKVTVKGTDPDTGLSIQASYFKNGNVLKPDSEKFSMSYRGGSRNFSSNDRMERIVQDYLRRNPVEVVEKPNVLEAAEDVTALLRYQCNKYCSGVYDQKDLIGYWKATASGWGGLCGDEKAVILEIPGMRDVKGRSPVIGLMLENESSYCGFAIRKAVVATSLPDFRVPSRRCDVTGILSNGEENSELYAFLEDIVREKVFNGEYVGLEHKNELLEGRSFGIKEQFEDEDSCEIAPHLVFCSNLDYRYNSWLWNEYRKELYWLSGSDDERELDRGNGLNGRVVYSQTHKEMPDDVAVGYENTDYLLSCACSAKMDKNEDGVEVARFIGEAWANLDLHLKEEFVGAFLADSFGLDGKEALEIAVNEHDRVREMLDKESEQRLKMLR